MARDGESQERIISHLFGEGAGTPALTPKEQTAREVYEQVFALWCEHPERTDRQMVAWVQGQFKRSHRQAMADIACVKSLLGRVGNAQREWHRYAVLEMLREAYQLARDGGDVKAMIRAAGEMGRITQLDKPEPEGVDWSQLESPSFEPTADAAMLGLALVENLAEAKARLERKLGVVTLERAPQSMDTEEEEAGTPEGDDE